MTQIVVVESEGLGGLVHWAYQICNALADAGADVTLLTSRHYELRRLPHNFRVEPTLAMWPNVASESAWVGRLPRAVRSLRHRIRRGVRGIRLMIVWAQLTRRLLRQRPEVVQFSLIRFPILALFLHRLRRAGLTLTLICHEPLPRDVGPMTRAMTRLLSYAVYGAFAHIFFLGETVRAEFLRTFAVDPARTSVIAHGNAAMFRQVDSGPGDLRQHYRLPRGAPVALFFGGLRRSKGLKHLIACFADVARQVADARLLVVGWPQAGVPLQQYSDLANDLGVGSAVIIDPRYVPIEEVGRLVRTANVVVLPYESGTASGVLQVAHAFERPVIVTQVGSVHEAVSDGVTGLVVPAGDRCALTQAMVKLLIDKCLAEAMGIEGAQVAAQRWGWPTIARQVLATTRALCAKEPAPRKGSVA
jgi:glycosyltransferase involved in cell wall biosynthesis